MLNYIWGKPHTPLTAHLAVGNLLVRTDIKVMPLSASPVGESTKAKTFNPSEDNSLIVSIVGVTIIKYPFTYMIFSSCYPISIKEYII